MLDRLAVGLVSLPDMTYDIVLLLSDADGTRAESQKLLDRQVIARIVTSLKAGGSLQSQDGSFAASAGPERTEAILAGLLVAQEQNGVRITKPQQSGSVSLPIKLGRKPAASSTILSTNGKRKESSQDTPTGPAGVGFVDFSDDLDNPELDDDSDDDLIDEDTLLTEDDMRRPIMPRKLSRSQPNSQITPNTLSS